MMQKDGTPGKKNSVDAINKDDQPPVLLSTFAADSVIVTLVFDEPLDSMRAATASDYIISDNIGVPQSAITIAP